MAAGKTCYHVNLYPGFGGSEVYTRFFCNAFAKLGWQVVLFIHPKADYWRRLDMPGVRLVEVERLAGVLPHLPKERALVIDHSPEPGEAARRIRAEHLFVGVVYQPVYQRDPEQYRVYEVLWHLSHHIENSLRQAGFANLHPEPFYGPGHAQRLSNADSGPIVANSPNVWDPRKLRDRVLGALKIGRAHV